MSKGYAPVYQQRVGEIEDDHTPKFVLQPTSSAATVLVKAKYHKRFKHFVIPSSHGLPELVACLKESFRVEYEGGASVGTAYILWVIFGFLGIHRFYIHKHNAMSWFVWLITGQLFGLGFLYDGATMWSQVEEYNKRRLDTHPPQGEGFVHWLFGFKDNERPSMVAAYLLWFFCGFVGIHRWYTGHCTVSSFFTWIVTAQMFGLGWFYDGYHTAYMVNHYRIPEKIQPFFVKAHDGNCDYMPVNTTEDLHVAMNIAFSRADDKTLRINVVDRKQDSIAYVLWLFFGLIGAHAWYLGLDPSSYITRFFTSNYFGVGWAVEGIRLDDLIEEANEKLAGDFVPSYHGKKHWPLTSVVVTA